MPPQSPTPGQPAQPTTPPAAPQPATNPLPAAPTPPVSNVPPAMPMAAPMPAGPRSTAALLSLIFALVGIIIPILLPLAGLICGIVALTSIKKTGQTGKGMAIAGIAVGSVLLVVQFLFIGQILAVITGGTPATRQSSSSSGSYQYFTADEAKSITDLNDQFLTDVKSNDYTAAYALTSPEFQKATTAAQAKPAFDIVKADATEQHPLYLLHSYDSQKTNVAYGALYRLGPDATNGGYHYMFTVLDDMRMAIHSVYAFHTSSETTAMDTAMQYMSGTYKALYSVDPAKTDMEHVK